MSRCLWQTLNPRVTPGLEVGADLWYLHDFGQEGGGISVSGRDSQARSLNTTVRSDCDSRYDTNIQSAPVLVGRTCCFKSRLPSESLVARWLRYRKFRND